MPQGALAHGLVNQVVAPDALDDAVRALAEKIAAKPAWRDRRWQARLLRTDRGERRGARIRWRPTKSPATLFAADTQEGIDAFLQKRTPRWS